MKRTGSAHWEGTGKEGKGHVSTQSTVLNQTQYSWGSRFAEGIGTNPEELIGAAHAGCFTMKLSFVLNEGGFTATSLDTKATVRPRASCCAIWRLTGSPFLLLVEEVPAAPLWPKP